MVVENSEIIDRFRQLTVTIFWYLGNITRAGLRLRALLLVSLLIEIYYSSMASISCFLSTSDWLALGPILKYLIWAADNVFVSIGLLFALKLILEIILSYKQNTIL